MLSRLEVIEGEGTAPHTSCIQRDGVVIIGDPFQGCPVAKDDFLPSREPIFMAELWRHFFARKGLRYGFGSFANEI